VKRKRDCEHYTNSSVYDKSILESNVSNDIIASILEIANGNRVRATEIQFKAYISYSILKEDLVLLLENDLLEYIEGESAFKTAPKGMQFLRTIKWAS
jgi:predicted transcriptional regulator